MSSVHVLIGIPFYFCRIYADGELSTIIKLFMSLPSFDKSFTNEFLYINQCYLNNLKETTLFLSIISINGFAYYLFYF